MEGRRPRYRGEIEVELQARDGRVRDVERN